MLGGPLHLLIILTNAEHNSRRQTRFLTSVTSCVESTPLDIHLHVVGDAHAIRLVESHVDHGHDDADGQHVTLSTYTIDELEAGMLPHAALLDALMVDGYYGKKLFFVSMLAHRLLPDVERLVQIDADIRCDGDLGELWRTRLDDAAVMAIAYEQQPVYSVRFGAHRRRVPSSTLGTAEGMRGFNTGVMLMDLARMRASDEYNALLDAEVVEEMSARYSFAAHLGDQCFYTLMATEHAHLFDVLPCEWNRQLCEWWLHKGRLKEDLFDAFHTCAASVKIWHGNCDTEIPAPLSTSSTTPRPT